MKILIFTNSLAGGGAERTAATLANFWARQGWDVTIVTLDSERSDFYGLDKTVRRIAMNMLRNSDNVLFACLQNVQRILALRRILKQLRPAVALSLMSTPNVLLAFASRGLPDLTVIGSEHEYPPHVPLGFIWTRLRRKMYGKLDAVAALTHECALWIKENSSARRVPIIPNPIEWPFPDHPPRISPDAFFTPGRCVLLAVGRLTTVKNLGVLIRVFAQLAGKYGEWDLFILGEGPERSSLESMVHEHGMENRIVMPGIAGNVGEWYAHADLYAMTSHSEGFPNTLAEALAHGLPAVSFDCDTGPRDIIRHGVDGLLVSARDATALAGALERLMRDPVLRATFAENALEARERFSIAQIAGRWAELFSTVPGTPARPGAMRGAWTANR